MSNILERIHKSVIKFLTPLAPEETYAIVVDEAVKLVNGQYGSIMLYEKGELVRIYASHPDLYHVETGRRNPLGINDPRYEVLEKKTPVVLSANQMDQLEKKFPYLRNVKERAAIIIPLSYKNKSIGILSVVSLKDENFTKKELGVLSLFGTFASLAIRKTQLYDETKQALNLRDLFISMAAHELRTPLTTICGYAQLLQAKLGGRNDNEGQWAGELYKESLRLKDLINELLVVNRIRAGQLSYNFSECDLGDIVARAISAFSVSHPGRKITFANEAKNRPSIVIGDSNKLLQVVINIIENAIKHSPVESEVLVYLNDKPKNLILGVSDQGRGIPRKDLPKVFERFYKGENSKGESLGIGLFLAKNIIEKHNGKITVHSKINKGTTVEIRLPKMRR